MRVGGVQEIWGLDPGYGFGNVLCSVFIWDMLLIGLQQSVFHEKPYLQSNV